jgi:hypothetical protein
MLRSFLKVFGLTNTCGSVGGVKKPVLDWSKPGDVRRENVARLTGLENTSLLLCLVATFRKTQVVLFDVVSLSKQ